MHVRLWLHGRVPLRGRLHLHVLRLRIGGHGAAAVAVGDDFICRRVLRRASFELLACGLSVEGTSKATLGVRAMGLAALVFDVNRLLYHSLSV